MSDTPQKTLRFAAPVYPGGRHCLICGNVTVGAVFPPGGGGRRWHWRMWFTGANHPDTGDAKSEETAKAATMAAFWKVMEAAELKVLHG